ncbi:hypothetical protein TcWFU_006590 [Taenia crassiceps]|uniref:Uncharacterized protein n=1 Tax=Taenia crassiceps TaxID=6207 RepID=A0ABR4QHK0_9CEST
MLGRRPGNKGVSSLACTHVRTEGTWMHACAQADTPPWQPMAMLADAKNRLDAHAWASTGNATAPFSLSLLAATPWTIQRGKASDDRLPLKLCCGAERVYGREGRAASESSDSVARPRERNHASCASYTPH